MDDLDKTIKELLEETGNMKITAGNDDCPDDIIIASYIDGLLSGVERESVEEHLSGCDLCLDLIILSREIIDSEKAEAQPELAPGLIGKVKKLHSGLFQERKTSFFDIALNFAKDSIQILSNPGNLSISYGPAPEPLRSDRDVSPPNVIILSKTTTKAISKVEVEKIDEQHLNLNIKTMGVQSGIQWDGLRISLFNPDREIASYITENGQASFRGLKFGRYNIIITESGEEIGNISINIRHQ